VIFAITWSSKVQSSFIRIVKRVQDSNMRYISNNMGIRSD
jgi:hypothetical protein